MQFTPQRTPRSQRFYDSKTKTKNPKYFTAENAENGEIYNSKGKFD
jgi:hypothetical protein